MARPNKRSTLAARTPIRRPRLRQALAAAQITLLLLAAACAGRRVASPSTALGSDVQAARMKWNAALAARDSNALARMVEDSAVHVSPRFTHVGRTAFLATFLRAMTTRPQFLLIYRPERTADCERLPCVVATEYGTWVESWLQDGEPTEVSGTYYAMWRRNGDAWQIRSEVFATTRCRGSRYCGS